MSPAAGTVSLAAWMIAVGLAFWPLGRYAATHIPATLGSFNLLDTLHVAWVNAHATRALTTSPCSLLDTRVYHPHPRTLFYNTTAFGFLPFFAPIFLASGNAILALNVAFLVSVALSTWAIHLLVWRWTGDPLPGVVAGITFLASGTPLVGFVSGAPFYAVLAPLAAIVHAVAYPTSRLAAPGVLGPLIALQCLVDPLYVAPVVLAPVVAVACVRSLGRGRSSHGTRLWRALGIATLFLLPVYCGYADVALREPSLRGQTLWRASSVPGEVTAQPSWLEVAADLLREKWVLLPVPLLALGLIAAAIVRPLRAGRDPAADRRAWTHCAFWAVTASFAPPLVRACSPVFRGIQRGEIVGLVALSILTGLAFATLVRDRSPRGRAILALGVAVLLVAAPRRPGLASAFAVFPDYPLQPAPRADSALVAALRGGSSPLVEVPAGTALLDMAAQYRSVLHGRRVLNGYGSYYPHGVAERLALANELPNPKALATLRSETGLGTVVIHWAETPPPRRRAWDRAIAGGDFRVVARVDGTLVVDVVSEP